MSKIKLLVFLFLYPVLATCAQRKAQSSSELESDSIRTSNTSGTSIFILDTEIYNSKAIAPDDGKNVSFGQNLAFGPANKAKKIVESQFKVKLKDRGEAHITLITPPEYAMFAARVPMSKIHDLAVQEKIQSANFKVECIGRGQVTVAKKKLQNYFFVVTSVDLLNFRKKVQSAIITAGGKPSDFDPGHFYPHVTLGFTERDLHEQDGVIKDSKTCILFPN